MKATVKLIEARLAWISSTWEMSSSKRERISELQVLLLLCKQIEEGRQVEDVIATLKEQS